MSDEIKPEVIKMTQDTLGKYIKKPPLTDKLLKKPPFRFLHDIITTTIRDTGFLAGLYSEKEMISDNIKDRESKIAFLQKLIDCIILVTDKKLSVRPNKIVAGLEPIKTNELLQAIGTALNKKLDSTEAVAKVAGGQTKVKARLKDDKKSKEKTDSKSTKKDEKVPPKNKIKESPRNKDKLKDDKKKGNIKISPKAKTSKEKIDTPKESPKEDIKKIEQAEIIPEVTINTEILPLPPQESEIVKQSKIETEIKTETPIIENKEPEVLIKEITRPKTSLRPPSVRPSSARPGAPRLKDRNELILPPDEFITMGKVKVIVETFNNQEEDNEETVVVENPPDLPLIIAKPDIEFPAEKGHLVNQILEQIEETPHKSRVEIEWETGGNRNREAANKEMEKLRDSIQTLTRSANPLGKLMNFLQEDVDSMRSELKMWIETNEKLSAEIKMQEKLNEESIEPLKTQLNKLEGDIEKQYELISETQGNILRNEQKIKMLLTREV